MVVLAENVAHASRTSSAEMGGSLSNTAPLAGVSPGCGAWGAAHTSANWRRPRSQTVSGLSASEAARVIPVLRLIQRKASPALPWVARSEKMRQAWVAWALS